MNIYDAIKLYKDNIEKPDDNDNDNDDVELEYWDRYKSKIEEYINDKIKYSINYERNCNNYDYVSSDYSIINCYELLCHIFDDDRIYLYNNHESSLINYVRYLYEQNGFITTYNGCVECNKDIRIEGWVNKINKDRDIKCDC